MRARLRIQTAVLLLIPILIAAWIGLSPLSFVPVPWPDDSAFYFVGREFFRWPPRWVMLPQAPFEPTYRIYNFNTMPLYPMLIGLGRWIGIDGSHAIKLWPLGALALSGGLLGAWLYRAGLPWIAALGVSLALMLDPGTRWASVLVRPESLIGWFGVALVLGLSLGFPKRLRPSGYWHPVSALLALSAYAHFNAVHLLFPVVLAYAFRPRELVRIGLRTALYLTPWLMTVALHPRLFLYQMTVQWSRLTTHNEWLDSIGNAVKGIYVDMGSPEPWPDSLRLGAYVIWVLILAAIALGMIRPLVRIARTRDPSAETAPNSPRLLPAAGWIVGTLWLWQNKPEVWFTYYIHVAVWTFAGIALLAAWASHRTSAFRAPALAGLGAAVASCVFLFGWIDVAQARRLGETRSWHWPIYHDWVGCIDEELGRAEQRLGYPKPFRVWAPTFPDVTVELSRRHPDWEFTRTCDFWDRQHLALQHGRDAEAVVVTEMLNWPEHEISAPQSRHPDIRSVWMTWETHFLNQLWNEPGWKPNRYLCQRGRWQAFIFEK